MDKGLVKQQSELCGLSLHKKQMLVLYVGNFNLLVCERENYSLQSNYWSICILMILSKDINLYN